MITKVWMKIISVVLLFGTLYIVLFWKPNIVDNAIIEEKPIEAVENNSNNEVSINSESDIGISNDQDIKNEVQALKSIYLGDMSFSEVMTKISLEDKTQLNNILKKISVVEWNKVNQLLNSTDKNIGAMEAFSILKKRLKESDFEEIQRIMEKFIDFSTVNKAV